MISVRDLRAFTVRLSRLDVGRTEENAVEEVTRDIEATVKLLVRPVDYGRRSHHHGREAAALTAISHRVDERSAVIGATDSSAVVRELGSIAKSPDPFLSAAARQSGPAVAERIGRMFAELMSGMQSD